MCSSGKEKIKKPAVKQHFWKRCAYPDKLHFIERVESFQEGNRKRHTVSNVTKKLNPNEQLVKQQEISENAWKHNTTPPFFDEGS